MPNAEQGIPKAEVQAIERSASEPAPMNNVSDDRKLSTDARLLSFVSDGHERAVLGIEQSLLPEIQQTVEAEYAVRLQGAGLIGRLWIRFLINRKVMRRFSEQIEKHAPPDAMYVKH